MWILGEAGLRVIDDAYPVKLKADYTETPPLPALGPPAHEMFHRRKSAIVLAVKLDTLRREAERTGVELACRGGNFVPTGEPLFRLDGGAALANDPHLQAAIAMGRERTIEQDATFAFYVIVDIAIKALSSVINDPTTAVLAIDQLYRLLRIVGRRRLHDEGIRDEAGKLRVVYRTPA